MISAPSWCGSASRRGGRAVGRSRTGATAHPDLGFDQGWPGFMMTERAAPPACRAGGRSHAQQIAGEAIRASAVERSAAHENDRTGRPGALQIRRACREYPVRGRADVAKLCAAGARSEEHTSELQSLMRNSYAVFCLKKKK